MKKKLLALVSICVMIALAFSLAGCHKTSTDETAAEGSKSVYEQDLELYQEIIDELPDGSYYAFADMSPTHDALLVTDTIVQDPVTGEYDAAIATVYGLDKGGNIKNYGAIKSGSTADPFVTNDHYIYYGSHHEFSRATIDESTSKLVVETGKDEAFDGTEEDVKLFNEIFEEYTAGTIVTFTATEATAAANAAAAANAKESTTKDTAKKSETTTKSVKTTTAKATTKKAKTKTTTEATGSPVQRFQGRYGNGRCTIDVVGVANNTVEIHVYWSSSAWEHSEWTMSGNFDEDENGFYVYYSDGVKKDYRFDDDGEEESCETVYVGGKGAFRFNGNKMTWDDHAEHIADGITFTK